MIINKYTTDSNLDKSDSQKKIHGKRGLEWFLLYKAMLTLRFLMAIKESYGLFTSRLILGLISVG